LTITARSAGGTQLIVRINAKRGLQEALNWLTFTNRAAEAFIWSWQLLPGLLQAFGWLEDWCHARAAGGTQLIVTFSDRAAEAFSWSWQLLPGLLKAFGWLWGLMPSEGSRRDSADGDNYSQNYRRHSANCDNYARSSERTQLIVKITARIAGGSQQTVTITARTTGGTKLIVKITARIAGGSQLIVTNTARTAVDNQLIASINTMRRLQEWDNQLVVLLM
jgi:hypothetical protein